MKSWVIGLLVGIATVVGAYIVASNFGLGRYRIVEVWEPADPSILPPPNGTKEREHQTIMLDTVTGKTWKLGMVPVKDEKGNATDVFEMWWVYIGYKSYPEPNPEIGSRLPR